MYSITKWAYFLYMFMYVRILIHTHGSCFVKTVNPVSVKYLWIKQRQKTSICKQLQIMILLWSIMVHDSWRLILIKNTLHFPQTAHLMTVAHRIQNNYKQDVHLHFWMFNCCFVAWKGDLPPKFICFVLSYYLAFLLTFYVSGPCFRMLAVIPVLYFFKAVGAQHRVTKTLFQ